jgi:MoaA/NifB/PqqE/SkfB family radical SAM enzyme
MSYNALVERAWEQNLLLSALVELTYRCNLDCFFCYNDLQLRGTPLTTAQYLQFFSDLRELQTLNLTFTGGEPLAHPDFFLLGRAARELGFVVRIKSNGHALRQRLARRLQTEVDPFLIEVSLHGASAPTHDRQTRVSGSFERLMTNLAQALALGLRIKLNCTLTAWNEHELEDIYALADRLGAPLQVDHRVTPRDDGDLGPLAISPSREGLKKLFHLQAARAKRTSPPAHATRAARDRAMATPLPAVTSGISQKQCGAGSAGIAVDPYGTVYPCVQWRHPIGQLQQQRIQDIWRGSKEIAQVRLDAIRAKRAVDAFGSAGTLMNFCPGLAASHTGDAAATYAQAIEEMDLRRQDP